MNMDCMGDTEYNPKWDDRRDFRGMEDERLRSTPLRIFSDSEYCTSPMISGVVLDIFKRHKVTTVYDLLNSEWKQGKFGVDLRTQVEERNSEFLETFYSYWEVDLELIDNSCELMRRIGC